MSEIKLEVGQVWKLAFDKHIVIGVNASDVAIQSRLDGRLSIVAAGHITRYYTLITNGTPYIKPNKLKSNSEKRMSEIKLEVGQMWGHPKNHHIDIIGLNKSCEEVAIQSRQDGRLNIVNASYITGDYTLIINSNGTPYVKPNDYRDGDIWVFCGRSGDSLGDAYLIKTVDGVKMVSSMHLFKRIELSALLSLPQDYKLIYRKGQGVIND